MERAQQAIPLTPIELYAYAVIVAMFLALALVVVWLLWPIARIWRAPDPGPDPITTIFAPPSTAAPAPPRPVWLTPEQRAAAERERTERTRARQDDTILINPPHAGRHWRGGDTDA